MFTTDFLCYSYLRVHKFKRILEIQCAKYNSMHNEGNMKKIRIRRTDKNEIFYVLIALFCMNFLGRGSVICTIFAVLAVFRLPRKIAVDTDMLYVFALSAVSAVASLIYEGINEVVKCLNFLLLYCIGLNWYYASKNKLVHLKKTLYAVCFGYTLLVALICYSSILEQNYTNTQYLLTINYWTGEKIATTLVGLVSSVVIAFSFYGLFCQGSKKLKLLATLSIGTVLYISVVTATRTPVLLFLIVWFLMLGIYSRERNQRKMMIVWLVITAILLLILFLFVLNAFSFKDYVLSQPLFDRLSGHGLKTGRFQIAKNHLSYMIVYPWGGSNIKSITGHAAHNYIQQGHDLYGIFATVTLCLLEVSFIMNIIRLIRRKRKYDIDYLLISLYISMLIMAHWEPVFTGYPCYLFSFFMIHGMTNGYLRTEKVDLTDAE